MSNNSTVIYYCDVIYTQSPFKLNLNEILLYGDINALRSRMYETLLH